MYWKTPEQPVIGDRRWRRKFAWWPVECSDGTTRWLEWVVVCYRYQCYHHWFSGELREKWTRSIHDAPKTLADAVVQKLEGAA